MTPRMTRLRYTARIALLCATTRCGRGYRAPARPAYLPRAEIESRVEGIVGNWIEGVDDEYKRGHLYGSRYVEATPRDGRTIHIDLDLTAINNNWPDGEADVDFDLQFACSGGRLSLAVANVSIRDYMPGRNLDAPAVSDPVLRDRLQVGLSAPLNALNSVLSIYVIAQCPDVLVDGGGNLMVPQITSDNVVFDDPPILK
jgi:hypothetical protein